MSVNNSIGVMPSTSTIVYLWADTFAATLQPGQKGMRSYSTGAVVETKALAQMMCAVTFAELQAANLIALEPYSKKSFGLFTSKGINVRTLGQVSWPGNIPQRIAASRTAATQGEPVGDIVRSLVKRSSRPNAVVVEWGIDDAVQCGLLRREGVGGVRGVAGAVEITAVAEAIESTRERAAAVAATWMAFRDNNRDLAVSLRAEIGKAIDMRSSQNDDRHDDDATD